MKPKQVPIPGRREATLRQSMIVLLRQSPLSATEISAQVGLSEREVYGHLKHIRHSLHREAAALTVLPAKCRGCGFAFTKRDRLKRPGCCPLCRGQSISQPRYLIE
jgi:hypothetical protein